MFDTLLESNAKKHGSIGQTVTSVVVHITLIYGAIQVTQGAASVVQGIFQDTTIMFLTPPPPPPPTVVVTTTPPPQGFQTVMPPTEIPTTIPPVNLSERFDARDFSGKGVEGGIATGVIGGTGVVPTTETVTGETFLDSQVDDPVVEINRPQPRYPPVLQQAGISGKVMLEYVVDTTGRVERGSVKILSSTNAQFEAPAREAVEKATFKPARIRGQAVRQLVRQAITFTIGR